MGHDLKDLLSDLSPGVQARIVAETRTQRERPTFLDQQLEIVRDVFDVWRYIYEKEHIVDTDLGFLAAARGGSRKGAEGVPGLARRRNLGQRL